MLTALVWHQIASLFLSFEIDSKIDWGWNKDLRRASFQANKCSCFWKQQGQTVYRGTFVTLHLRVNFLATVSFFPFKFIPARLTCYWIKPCCDAFSSIHHLHSPIHTLSHPHISTCSENDRSRLHHIHWHCEKAIECFSGVFFFSVT